jgi:hypothetical protein
MILYIAGPMTGYAEHNFPAFHAAAADLRAQGHEVVSPAEQPWNDVLTHPWDYYLRRDLAVMLGCEGVALLPGWRASKGARLEAYVATELGMATFEYTPPPARTIAEA